MAETGDFILKNKNPKAERIAVHRVGTDEHRALYEKGRKKKADATEKELSEKIAAELLPKWLLKLETQLTERDAVSSGVNLNLFVRWAERNNAVTKKLPEAEYLRIASTDGEPRSREEVVAGLKAEQIDEYERWLSYLLVNEGREEYEPWFRYLVLSEITKRDDRGRRRDPETTSGVLPFSMNALGRVRDDFTDPLRTYLHESTMARSAPSKEERIEATTAKTEALNVLTSYPFYEKYQTYLAEEAQAENEKLNYTNGWHTLIDPVELARISRGTPWCLAGLKVAEGYLGKDDAKLRVFFEDGRPKIGVHVVGGEVREVRGADDSQNLDPTYATAVQTELAQYNNGGIWERQAEDARMLGEIFVLCYEDPAAPLSVAQLRFLYEIDRPIEYFGYGRDERVENILAHRTAREDALLIFECEEQQVAHTLEDIGPDTKAWLGPLSPGVLSALAAQRIEHIYTSFPEERIEFHHLALPTEKTGADYAAELTKEGIQLSPYTRKMLESPEFAEEGSSIPEDAVFVEVSVAALGFDSYTKLETIEKRGDELDLVRAPRAVGPLFRLLKRDGRFVVIDMDPIGVDGVPCVFYVRRRGDGLWLGYDFGRPERAWNPDRRFLFLLCPRKN